MAAAPLWNRDIAANDVGYVYFVRMGAAVKIGHTMDIASRLKTIKTSCPDQVHLMGFVPGSREIELDFHRRFKQHREHGEWFAIQGSLATFLNDCPPPAEIPPPIVRKNFFDALLESTE
jgi:hypothetical protein